MQKKKNMITSSKCELEQKNWQITQTPKQKVLFSKMGRSNYCTPTPGPIGP